MASVNDSMLHGGAWMDRFKRKPNENITKLRKAIYNFTYKVSYIQSKYPTPTTHLTTILKSLDYILDNINKDANYARSQDATTRLSESSKLLTAVINGNPQLPTNKDLIFLFKQINGYLTATNNMINSIRKTSVNLPETDMNDSNNVAPVENIDDVQTANTVKDNKNVETDVDTSTKKRTGFFSKGKKFGKNLLKGTKALGTGAVSGTKALGTGAVSGTKALGTGVSKLAKISSSGNMSIYVTLLIIIIIWVIVILVNVLVIKNNKSMGAIISYSLAAVSTIIMWFVKILWLDVVLGDNITDYVSQKRDRLKKRNEIRRAHKDTLYEKKYNSKGELIQTPLSSDSIPTINNPTTPGEQSYMSFDDAMQNNKVNKICYMYKDNGEPFKVNCDDIIKDREERSRKDHERKKILDEIKSAIEYNNEIFAKVKQAEHNAPVVVANTPTVYNTYQSEQAGLQQAQQLFQAQQLMQAQQSMQTQPPMQITQQFDEQTDNTTFANQQYPAIMSANQSSDDSFETSVQQEDYSQVQDA